MKPIPSRKTTRFFVVNPKTDRRKEARFASREDVVIRLGWNLGGKSNLAVAYDIGKTGLKLETEVPIVEGTEIQVIFSNSAENVRCFGVARWSKPIKDNSAFEGGIKIREWFGIIEGPRSYRKYRGQKAKKDRRLKKRH